MQISDILGPNGIKLFAGCTSKKRLFHDMAELAASAYGVAAEQTAHALMERETLGSTAVGQGVALPHARLPGLDKVQGVFARYDKPIDFGAADRLPVDLVFVLLAPLDAGVDHLKALALVSRTLRNADIREKLRANNDVATLHTVLTEVPAVQAA